MKRVGLVVAYDGTNYSGWQIQPNGITIQGVLNDALTDLLGEKIEIMGASRTDAGVHALGNVAVFDTNTRIPGEKISYALNQRLPEDIVIQSSKQVADDFHPRHCDCRKTYEYDILNRTFPLPAYRNTVHFLYGTLNIEAMRRACQAFLGEHDFASFCAAGAQVQTTVRTIYSLEVECRPLTEANAGSADQLLTIRVKGNGFLYNMVRIIAGTLVEVGRGHIKPEEVAGIIAVKDRAKAGPTAPARGLRLVEIEYLQ